MSGQIDLSKYALFRDFTDDAKGGCKINVYTAEHIVAGIVKNVRDVADYLERFSGAYKIELVKTTEKQTIKKNVFETIHKQLTQQYWIADKIEYTETANGKKVVIMKGKRYIQSKNVIKSNQAPTNLLIPGDDYLHTLSDNDVVLDRNLKQIYPENTGKIPMVLSRIIRKTR